MGLVTRGFGQSIDYIVTRGFESFTEHRAETILKAIHSLLLNKGYSTVRDRTYPPDVLPSLSVNQGEDSREENPSTMSLVESSLTVFIEIRVKTDDYSSEINKIRSNIYNTMLSSNRLGLDYVESLRWISDDAPEIDSESETVTAFCVMTFEIGYVHSLLDKGA